MSKLGRFLGRFYSVSFGNKGWHVCVLSTADCTGISERGTRAPWHRASPQVDKRNPLEKSTVAVLIGNTSQYKAAGPPSQTILLSCKSAIVRTMACEAHGFLGSL